MKILAEEYNSDYTVEIDTDLQGIIAGNVRVQNSVTFIINGTIVGDLIIENNSRAIIYGTVIGNVQNNGVCEIYGIVDGNLIGLNQSIFIDQNAIIHRK